MWRSKAVLVFRRVSSAINTSASIRCKFPVSTTIQQNQVVSVIPIRSYSSAVIHAKNVRNPNNVNAASHIKPYSSDKPLDKNTVILDDSENPACEKDIERLVSLLENKQMKGKKLEKELEALDLNINEKMIEEVVLTTGISTKQFIRFFTWAVKQHQFVPSRHIIDIITRAVHINDEGKGLEYWKNSVSEISVKYKGVITTPSLDILIESLGFAKRANSALWVFQHFDKFECKPEPMSYLLTIWALCDSSMFDKALFIFEEMEKAGYFPGNGVSTVNKLIKMFCESNRPKDAHMIYLKSIEKGQFPGQVTISALVDSLCDVEMTPNVAVEILRAIPSKERKHALKAHFKVIRAFCNNQQTEEAQALLSQMVEVGPRPDHAIYNAVITALCKSENPEEAMLLLEQMPSRRLKPDRYAYNVIMASFARAGKMQEASDVFSKAREGNINFPLITYKILIDGFCRVDDPKNAYKYFAELKESGHSPTKDIYTKLIRAYSLQGLNWNTAKELLHEMKEKGHFPSMYIQSLVHATEELAEEALQAEAGLTRA